MTEAAQGIDHRTRISTALTLVAYADSALQELPGHAVSQLFTLAAHLAERHGDLDEDGLAIDLAAAGWHQYDGVPSSGTQKALAAIGPGVAWWRATRTRPDGRGSYGSDAAVRACAVGLVPSGFVGEVAQLARRSSMITHCHPDARDAAAVQACAMALACTEPGASHLDIDKYISVLSAQCRGGWMARLLALVGQLAHGDVTPTRAAEVLGDGVAAPAAVAAALAGFLRHPGQPQDAIAWTQAMGTRWHASTVMAAALAGAAGPHARPPVIWRIPAQLRTEIAAVATALVAASTVPGRRRLARSHTRPLTPAPRNGLSHNCHDSGGTPPHRLGNLAMHDGHAGNDRQEGTR